ncbi:methyltransferase [Promicromonospora sukumoe]|uniref:methyltransferase n=1 Tax=Promicromonospora sukumoe TaxID=88382 RepID=UPI0004784C4E|nr:methyltransferase [Promicromonospora sukumoe]
MEQLVARLRAAGCVFAEDEARILVEAATSDDVTDDARLEALVAARVDGLPLEHLVGWAELDGRRWGVAPGVFVPRQRSELLVREAAARALSLAAAVGAGASAGALPGAASEALSGAEAGPVLLVDLCCGCGALGGAVAARLLAAGHDVELHAADVDPVAVTCAHENLEALAAEAFAARAAGADRAQPPGRLSAQTYTGDLGAPLPAEAWGRVDVLVANAPYVPTEAIGMMPPEAREHEPHAALDGGDDGLAILRRVIDLAPALLRPGGHLLVETGEAQVGAAVGHLEAAGLVPTVLTDDDLGATALVGTAPLT